MLPSIISGGVFTANVTMSGSSHTHADVAALSGSDRIAIAIAGVEDAGSDTTITAATWGGVAMTSLSEVVVNGGGNSNPLHIFYLLEDDFPTDTTDDVVVTASESVNNNHALTFLQIQDADQAAPAGVASTTSISTADLVLSAVSSVADSLVIAAAVSDRSSVAGITLDQLTATLVTEFGDDDYSMSVGRRDDTTATTADIEWSDTSSTIGNVAIAFPIEPAASGTTVAVGTAAETDTAPAVAPSKTVQTGQAIETDDALAAAPSKSVALGQILESDQALPIQPSKSAQLGQAQEADTALPLAQPIVVQVGIAQETDTAIGLILGLPEPSLFLVGESAELVKLVGQASDLPTLQGQDGNDVIQLIGSKN